MQYEVRAWATDWCGFESVYTITATSEDEACDLAIEELVQEYNLIQCENGEYGESEDFDEDGEPLEEDSLSTIDSEIYTA